MTRRSDLPGSYREWAAEQRAADQAEKRAEQQRKARERDRLAKEAIARDDGATAKTAAVDRQVATLQGLLRASLSRDPRISLAALRRRARGSAPGTRGLPGLSRLRGGRLEPEPLRAFGRMFGGQGAVTRRPANKPGGHSPRPRPIIGAGRRSGTDKSGSEAHQAHDRQVADTQRQVDAHNAHVDQYKAGLREHDRHAVSEYVQIVLDRSPYPAQFPASSTWPGTASAS